MYSEADLEAAVSAGILTPEAAARFRAFCAQQRIAPAVDEEYVRLLTGFNDIFVSIAIALVTLAAGWLLDGSAMIDGLALAAGAWALAEYFTRQRRMALPSILLLLIYAGGLFAAELSLIHNVLGINDIGESPMLLAIAAAGAVLAGMVYLHWQRFHVPITVAAGAAAVALFAITLLLAIIPGLRAVWEYPALVAGLGVFALALRWDAADRARLTRRADVAFWLHLAAAPLIVHPLFWMLGLLGGNGTPDSAHALGAIAVYAVLGLVALAVDRRALLVSALGYVMFALSSLIHAGLGSEYLAATALAVGSGLLLLSALWHKARTALLLVLPAPVRGILPAV
jgi:hypothetical protein